MQTTTADSIRHWPGRVLAPAMALLLLSILAVPAEAQRGRGGHGGRGGSGHYGKSHGGHGGYGHGGHRYGGRHGYRGRHGHRYGDRGYRGYRAATLGGPYRGYRAATLGGPYRGYRGDYGYASHGPYVYYRDPGSWGFGYYGSGVSLYYEAAPRTVVYPHGGAGSGSRYDAYLAAPESGVTESGAPVAGGGGPAPERSEPFDARPEPARVSLAFEPGDASVYLDGAFLGLASELPAELWIDPGAHRLEIARPGYQGQALDLDLEAGEELEIDGRLELGRQR